jgi:hypothetical protein
VRILEEGHRFCRQWNDSSPVESLIVSPRLLETLVGDAFVIQVS